MNCHKSQLGHISHSMQGSRQKINGILWATSSVQISGSWWWTERRDGEDMLNGEGKGWKKTLCQMRSNEVGWACWLVKIGVLWEKPLRKIGRQDWFEILVWYLSSAIIKQQLFLSKQTFSHAERAAESKGRWGERETWDKDTACGGKDS